jgi:hypothetical protein
MLGLQTNSTPPKPDWLNGVGRRTRMTTRGLRDGDKLPTLIAGIRPVVVVVAGDGIGIEGKTSGLLRLLYQYAMLPLLCAITERERLSMEQTVANMLCIIWDGMDVDPGDKRRAAGGKGGTEGTKRERAKGQGGRRARKVD